MWDYFFTIDWAETFVPQMTLPEALIRGTVVYFALLALLRVIPKWQAGPGSIASMLFVVMLGGLAADAVKGGGESVTDLLLMIATVMFWVIIVDRLAYRFPWFHSMVEDSPTCLIRDGQILHQNLRRETIAVDDLKAQLRRQGVEDIDNVREAFLEPDGNISVVKHDEANGHSSHKPTAKPRSPAGQSPCEDET